MVKYIAKIAHGSDVYYVKDTEARSALIDKTEKGAANGIATLDAAGKVPSSQLPSYVDDVIEGYYNDGNFYTTLTPGQDDEPDTYSGLITAESDKIYVDKSTNLTYRWSGSVYVTISSPQIYTAGDGLNLSNGEFSVDNTVVRIGGTDSQQTLNAPDIVNNVAYNSSTHKLTMVKNSVASDIVEIVTSGFQLTTNETTGADVFTAVGTATITNDTTTGADVFTF